MPTRLLREGYLDSERVNALSDPAECLFVRLMLLADDFGRFDARPNYIISRAYPVRRDVSEKDIARRLEEMSKVSLILLYQVDGKPYLEIQNFHQRTRAKMSKFPAPDGTRAVRIERPAYDDTRTKGEAPAELVEPNKPPSGALLARAEARAIALRALAYLNKMAGTQFRFVDGTLQWPINRLLEGATEQDLIAVIDAKVAQTAKNEFDRKFLRPETLFNATKFNSYLGQIGVQGLAPGVKAKPPIQVTSWKEGDTPKSVVTFSQVGTPDPFETCKAVLRAHRNRVVNMWQHSNMAIEIDGTKSVFSVKELEGNG